MATGTYAINEGSNAPSKKEILFRSGICILLAFIAVCVLILLARTIWTKKDSNEDDKKGEVYALGSENGNVKSTTNKILVSKHVSTQPTTKFNTITNTIPFTTEVSKETTKKANIFTSSTKNESTEEPSTKTKTTPLIFIVNTTREPNISQTVTTNKPISTISSSNITFFSTTSNNTTGSTNFSTLTTRKLIKIPVTTEITTNSETELTTEVRKEISVKSTTRSFLGKPTTRITTESTELMTNSSTDPTTEMQKSISTKTTTRSFLGKSVEPTTKISTEPTEITTNSEIELTTEVRKQILVKSTTRSFLGKTLEPTTKITTEPTEITTTLETESPIAGISTNTTTRSTPAETKEPTTKTSPVETATEITTENTEEPTVNTIANITNNTTAERTVSPLTNTTTKTTDNFEDRIALFTIVTNNTTSNTTVQNLLTTVPFQQTTSSTSNPIDYDVAEAGGANYDESTESTDILETNNTTIIFTGHTTRQFSRNVTSTTPSTITYIPKAEKETTTDKISSRWQKMNTVTNPTLLLKEPEPVCYSVECKSAASRMLSLMDHSADACYDFYEFACGGMQTDSADSLTWESLSRQLHLINNATVPSYLQTFKNFYDSCVSHEYNFNYQERIDSVQKLVKEVGEILDEDTPIGTVDLTQLFANLILRQSLPFMDIDIDIDDQTSEFILKLTLPRPTSILKENGHWSALTETQKRCLDEQRHKLEQPNLDLTKIYESYLTCQKNHTIYLNSIETVVQALGFYSQLNNTFNETQQIQDILDILNILPLSNIVNQETSFKDYDILNISDIQNRYPFIEWKKLLNKITGRTFKDDTSIYIDFSAYFNNTFKKLEEIADWKLNNALLAMYAHNLYENLVIPQARLTRENYCLKLSSNLFRDVASDLYMKTWPQTEINEMKTVLTEIFHRLKQNLTSALRNQEWLDSSSKASAGFKLKKLRLILKKKDDNMEELDIKYSPVVMTTDFPHNAVKMIEIDKKRRYNLVGEEFSTDYLWSYFLNVYDNQPTSFYSQGIIMVPVGMIKQPVNGIPGYITMARIGLSLAKEIGRHFDPVGIQNRMTLSQQSRPSYKTLETVMENESMFNTTKFFKHHVASFAADPKLSVNTRIADNTAYRLISDSFDDFGDQTLLPWVSTSFSVEQIFHITAAQEYCQNTDMFEFMEQLFESETLPASLRVENIMKNSRKFSQAFNCPRDSRMNKNRKKMQFPYLLEEEIEL